MAGSERLSLMDLSDLSDLRPWLGRLFWGQKLVSGEQEGTSQGHISMQQTEQ